MEDLKEEIYKKYIKVLAHRDNNDIFKENLGFYIKNKCNSLMFLILINCVENIELFTQDQLVNIQYLLNRINYE